MAPCWKMYQTGLPWIAFPGKNYRIAPDFMGKKAMNNNNGSFSTKTSHYP